MPAAKKSTKREPRPELIHQFLVVLTGTDPLVWRRIQVPERYSSWDMCPYPDSSTRRAGTRRRLSRRDGSLRSVINL
jgi:hypothetical protein